MPRRSSVVAQGRPADGALVTEPIDETVIAETTVADTAVETAADPTPPPRYRLPRPTAAVIAAATLFFAFRLPPPQARRPGLRCGF